jgi:hypothetical protein
MTWYEKARSGYRARWEDPAKKSPAAGPIRPTREEAKRWAIEHGHDTPDISTLPELVKRWRAVKAADGRLMPSHLDEVEQVLTDLNKAREWATLAAITMQAIDDWKVATGGVGVSRPLSYLLSVLRFGVRQYGLPVDARVIQLRTPPPMRKVLAPTLLSDQQVDEILAVAGKKGAHVGALIHYLLTYGARPITAVTRTVGDVDFRAGTLNLTGKRSGQWRHALLPASLKLFLGIAKGRAVDEPLFLDPRTGKGWAVNRWHRASVLNSWYAYTIGRPVAGKELGGIYHLKRRAITTLLQRGMDPVTVARFTGHLTVAQVLKYARSNESVTRDNLHLVGVCVDSTHDTHKGPEKKARKAR